jgi:hypothetical protein
MKRKLFHFQPQLDLDRMRVAAAEFFHVAPGSVFIYSDAVDILGSAERAPDPDQVAAYEASDAAILLRRYEPGTGPLEGWLAAERHPSGEMDDQGFAQTLAAATGVVFYYADPVPDPDDEPGAGAAKIEVAPSGATRQVWVSEFCDADGTQIVVSGRGADEEGED